MSMYDFIGLCAMIVFCAFITYTIHECMNAIMDWYNTNC
jgi:hypothetical protein